MNIKINNYKNLKNLNLDIQENKINFIFGISGSGKSSIGEALRGENIEENALVGSPIDDVEILVNNNKMNESLAIFNTTTMEKLLLNNVDNNVIYDIIFDNNNKMLILRNDFESQIKGLTDFRTEIYDYISKIDKMNKAFGGKITKSEKLPNTAKIVKMANAISSGKENTTVKTIKEKGNWYIPWVKKGCETPEYKNNICPFCNKVLDSEIKEAIEKVLNYNEKDFEVMFQDETMLTDIGIKVPDYSNIEEVNELKDEIIRKVLLREELQNLINYMYYYDVPSLDPNTVKEIIMSETLKETFPDLKEKIMSVNVSIGKIKATLGSLKHETDKVISHNLKKLNSYLDRFRINYSFEVNSYSNTNNTLTYSLFNKLDAEKNNRVYGLSYGEKNLISLLLFLLSSKEKIIIIDDPASSFDDYRRKEILSLIYDICSSKTLMILSHDHIFVKYALFNYNRAKSLIDNGKDVSELNRKYYDFTGEIIAMENYSIGNIIIKKITYDDFDILQNHILKFMNNNMEYFRKIINLRLYYECMKSSEIKDIYNYLSSIYHKVPRVNILNMLNEKDIKEEMLLENIYKDTGIQLPSIPVQNYNQIKMNELTMFEKILYYRDEEKADIKELFNNVVHMNESLHVCLNPYEFNYFSPYIYSAIMSKN